MHNSDIVDNIIEPENTPSPEYFNKIDCESSPSFDTYYREEENQNHADPSIYNEEVNQCLYNDNYNDKDNGNNLTSEKEINKEEKEKDREVVGCNENCEIRFDNRVKKQCSSRLVVTAPAYFHHGYPLPRYHMANIPPFPGRFPRLYQRGDVHFRPDRMIRGGRPMFLAGQNGRRNVNNGNRWCKPGFPPMCFGNPRRTWPHPHYRPSYMDQRHRGFGPNLLANSKVANEFKGTTMPYHNTWTHPIIDQSHYQNPDYYPNHPQLPLNLPIIDFDHMLCSPPAIIPSDPIQPIYVDGGMNTDYEGMYSGDIIYARAYSNSIMAAVSNEDGGDGLYKEVDPYCLTDQFHIEKGFVKIYEAGSYYIF